LCDQQISRLRYLASLQDPAALETLAELEELSREVGWLRARIAELEEEVRKLRRSLAELAEELSKCQRDLESCLGGG